MVELTIFFWIRFSFTDGADDGGMFPLAALLTGALLTIGVAVLLIVVLAIKKNREQSQPHENGLKEKHIGWTHRLIFVISFHDDFNF